MFYEAKGGVGMLEKILEALKEVKGEDALRAIYLYIIRLLERQ
jgi:hypothetical protein